MKMHLSPDDYEIAKNNGIHKKLAYERFYKYGWSAERAITEAPQRDMSDWVALAKRNGISKGTFYHRVSKRMGWSPYKAATTPVRGASREMISTEKEFFGGAG